MLMDEEWWLRSKKMKNAFYMNDKD
jgi:hypothetical protein